MGCGKSSYGREMAQELGMRFIDLDEYIVKRECCSIADMFKERGEEKFRRLETRYLQEICELYESFVLSTGGGTPCFNDNMTYMNEQGETIFLNTDLETIIERLQKEGQRRPLLKGLNREEIRTFVLTHWEERKIYYRQARKTIIL